MDLRQKATEGQLQRVREVVSSMRARGVVSSPDMPGDSDSKALAFFEEALVVETYYAVMVAWAYYNSTHMGS